MSTLQDHRLFSMCFTCLKERCNKFFLYDITRNTFGHNNYEKIVQNKRNIKFSCLIQYCIVVLMQALYIHK
jgi:hypothetical protein